MSTDALLSLSGGIFQKKRHRVTIKGECPGKVRLGGAGASREGGHQRAEATRGCASKDAPSVCGAATSFLGAFHLRCTRLISGLSGTSILQRWRLSWDDQRPDSTAGRDTAVIMPLTADAADAEHRFPVLL